VEISLATTEADERIERVRGVVRSAEDAAHRALGAAAEH